MSDETRCVKPEASALLSIAPGPYAWLGRKIASTARVGLARWASPPLHDTAAWAYGNATALRARARRRPHRRPASRLPGTHDPYAMTSPELTRSNKSNAVNESPTISLFLAGDVMTGRGIDQILPHPSRPLLYESVVRDAREYVRLAETAHGPIPKPVAFSYIWGDALHILHRQHVDVKIVNLETSVTTCDEPWPAKEIHYRMHPQNVPCLTAAGIDCCVLANNHVLDWGRAGLIETLTTLDAAAVAHCGAGRNAAEAAAPAVLEVAGKGRVLVFGMGCASSGIPSAWAAGEAQPGVNRLADLAEAAELVAAQVRAHKQPGDVVVVSVHWGGNWGYAIPGEHIRFAHRVIEAGADLIHGHSSHHVLGMEVYRGRLILYGCGDFITDYEGIRGYEHYRGDLALMYLVRIDAGSGRLLEGVLIPLQARRLQLQRASAADARWLCGLLNRLCRAFGTRFTLRPDGSLKVQWTGQQDHS